MPPKPGVYKKGTVFVEKTDISRSSLQKGISTKSISYYSPYSYSTINPLFVLVDFSDTNFATEHTVTYYENLLYATTGKSLLTYYTEISGGALTVTNNGYYPTVLNNPYPMSAYGRDYSG